MLRKKIYFLFLCFFSLLILIDNSQKQTNVTAAPNNQTLVLGHNRVHHSAPVAADLNGNGRKEIVVGAIDGYLYIAAHNGSNWEKVSERQTALDINAALPVNEHQSDGIIDSTPAIGDIDNDGDLEIVITTGGAPNSATPQINRHGTVLVYEITSSNPWTLSVKPGWPYLMPDTMGQGVGGGQPDGVRDGIKTTPTLGDIDGDDDLEIIFISFDRRIRALHHDGTMVAGWPIQRENGDIILRGGESSAAIADIDGDGLNEIIVGTNSPPWNGDNRDGPFPPEYNAPDYALGTLWAINGDSTLVPGFPLITQQDIKSSPAVGDIDGDGDLEIVVGTNNSPSYVNGRQVYAWHHNGTLVSGWPVATDQFMPSSPALADLDKDGTLDVIIGCGTVIYPNDCHKLYAWNGSGNHLPGFPADLPNVVAPYPPVVADVDGDNNLEVLLTTLASQNVMVVQHNGNSGPIDQSRSTNTINLSSPLVDDLDNDGDLETVIASGASQATLFIFDEASSTSPTAQNLPWRMFQRNVEHTALILPPRLNTVSDIYILHQQGGSTTANHTIAVSNDGGGELSWNLDNGGTGGKVSVDTPPSSLQAGEHTAVSLSVDTTTYAVGQWHPLGTMQLSATSTEGTVQNTPQTVNVHLFIGDVSHTFLPMIIK